jgi:hypothetical protein
VLSGLFLDPAHDLITGPTDIYTQADTAGHNCEPLLVTFKHQGGGSTRANGDILTIVSAGGAGHGAGPYNLAKMVSTDGGSTWAKATIATPDASHTIFADSLSEMADGTLLLAYSYSSWRCGHRRARSRTRPGCARGLGSRCDR